MGRREEYLKERKRLSKLSILELEKLMGELGRRRFDENDITVENDFNLASSVYVHKTRKSGSLIFHLRNFVGALLFSIIFCIFIIYK